jgi:hypothetical protein
MSRFSQGSSLTAIFYTETIFPQHFLQLELPASDFFRQLQSAARDFFRQLQSAARDFFNYSENVV